MRIAAATIDSAHSPCTRASHIDEVESVAAAVELVAEIVPCRRSDAGDDTDPQRDRRQRLGPVGVEQAGRDEPPDDLVTRLRQLAEREAGIDPGHLQAEPSGRGVEVELAEDPDLHAVGELEPAALEQRREVAAHRREQRHVEYGTAVLAVLDEREVGVGAAHLRAVDLAPHPDAVVEPAAQLAVDRVRQLAHRVRRVGRVVERLVAEVEGGLAHRNSLPDRRRTDLRS